MSERAGWIETWDEVDRERGREHNLDKKCRNEKRESAREKSTKMD